MRVPASVHQLTVCAYPRSSLLRETRPPSLLCASVFVASLCQLAVLHASRIPAIDLERLPLEVGGILTAELAHHRCRLSQSRTLGPNSPGGHFPSVNSCVLLKWGALLPSALFPCKA